MGHYFWQNVSKIAQQGLIVYPVRLLIIVLIWLSIASSVGSQPVQPLYQVEYEGVLTSYAAGYIRRALREAEAANAQALLVKLTPQGTVLAEARALAREIAEARVPVIIYISPAGHDAGAAGTWLLAAAHIAAMAPDSRFGIAAPLLAPVTGVSETTQDLLLEEQVQQFETWGAARQRNVTWAEQALRSGFITTAGQAIETTPPIIDIVARDLTELLQRLEGRVVTLSDGTQITLSTLGVRPLIIEVNLVEAVLLILANPTVVFFLLIMAGLAFYAEFLSPTVGILAGLGVLLLAGAIIGMIALPVQWLSVLGILIAFGLVAADLFVPSHGTLTVIGVGVMIASSLTLFDSTQAPGVAVALWAIILVALLIALFAIGGLWLALRSRNRPVVTGQEVLIGRLAEVRKRLDPEGMVFVEGALWRAVCENGVAEEGEYVRVTGIYALRLTVRRIDPQESSVQTS
ncbi:nodulation protein NfeD [Chloroflexus sp. Y-396-1]|uniref:NfeD family protein n=1 Tax=Chloroflexus sp. Y-396-1 TaxID=867845 RepID=UPI0004B6105B|nr:NfeD family protein [Chloroflexus sp. Y-396-1]